MSLLDLLADESLATPTLTGAKCTFELLYATLTDEEAAALKAAVDNRAISHAKLSEVLFKAGHNVKPGTVSRHRLRGKASGCRCTQ